MPKPRRRKMTDGRMPQAGRRVTNTAPKFNSQRGVPGQIGEYANFPAPQDPPPGFLPMTPQFEAGRRGLDDQYQANKMNILNQQALVKPQFDQQMARLQTNQGYDEKRMDSNMIERGILGSGVAQQLETRDIDIPYGRDRSDLSTWASGEMAKFAQMLSGADLAYNQGLAELLLNRAADSAANIPMNVPQFSTGRRVLRGQKYGRDRKGFSGGGQQ